MKTAMVTKKSQEQTQKFSMNLNKQYFENTLFWILTLCLDDWMSKYKNSAEYSQLIKMEEQHILEHTPLLLSFL